MSIQLLGYLEQRQLDDLAFQVPVDLGRLVTTFGIGTSQEGGQYQLMLKCWIHHGQMLLSHQSIPMDGSNPHPVCASVQACDGVDQSPESVILGAVDKPEVVRRPSEESP